jgi:hypothetical protein
VRDCSLIVGVWLQQVSTVIKEESFSMQCFPHCFKQDQLAVLVVDTALVYKWTIAFWGDVCMGTMPSRLGSLKFETKYCHGSCGTQNQG